MLSRDAITYEYYRYSEREIVSLLHAFDIMKKKTILTVTIFFIIDAFRRGVYVHIFAQNKKLMTSNDPDSAH